MIKLLFNGGFTLHSAGDDGVIEAFLSLLRKEAPDTEFEARVLARHPYEEFDKAFGVTTFRNLEYETKSESVGRWLNGLNPDDSPEILLSLREQIEWADVVLLGAGNFLNENSFSLFRGLAPRLAVTAFIAKSVGKPIFLHGMSGSKLTQPLAILLVDWLLNNVDALAFREEVSPEILRKCGVRVPETSLMLGDIIFSGSAITRETARKLLVKEQIVFPSDSPVLAVSLRDMRGKPELRERYEDTVVKVLDDWMSGGGCALMIPQCTYDRETPESDDRKVAEKIVQRLSHPGQAFEIKGHHWPWEIEGLYGLCDAALTTRLHAGAYAAKQDVPTVAFAYEPKVRGLWKKLGFERALVELEDSPELIVAKLAEVREIWPSDEIRKRVDSIQSGNREYARTALKLAGVHHG